MGVWIKRSRSVIRSINLFWLGNYELHSRWSYNEFQYTLQVITYYYFLRWAVILLGRWRPQLRSFRFQKIKVFLSNFVFVPVSRHGKPLSRVNLSRRCKSTSISSLCATFGSEHYFVSCTQSESSNSFNLHLAQGNEKSKNDVETFPILGRTVTQNWLRCHLTYHSFEWSWDVIWKDAAFYLGIIIDWQLSEGFAVQWEFSQFSDGREVHPGEIKTLFFQVSFTPQSQSWLQNGFLEAEDLVEMLLKSVKVTKVIHLPLFLCRYSIFEGNLVLDLLNIRNSLSALDESVAMVNSNPLLFSLINEKDQQRRFFQNVADTNSYRSKRFLLIKCWKDWLKALGHR